MADRELLIDGRLDRALVDALVVARDENDVRQRREAARRGLIEQPALRGEEHDVTGGPLQLPDRGHERLRLEDHARAAAVRDVVDRAMAVRRPVAQVVEPELELPCRSGARDDALGERAFEHLREEREDADLHHSSSCGITTMRPAARATSRTTEAMPSQWGTAPTRKRSGTSLRGSTRTSPRTPCGDVMTPTTRPSASPTVLIDLEVDLGPIACRHHLQERADRFRDAAPAADDLPDVGFRHLQMQLEEIAVLLFLHHDARGVVDQGLRDVLEELGFLAHRATGGTSASGMPARTRSERAVEVGFAPFLIQCFTRSVSRTSAPSSVRGL